MGRVYAVASAKGGVGKTTTTANIGAALASTGASVVVVDADLGMPNLGSALGVEETPTVHDALAGDADAAAAAHEGVGGVAVVPGSDDIEDFRTADPAGLGDFVSDLADEYDYVILDGGAGLNHDSLVPLSVADEVVLVTGTGRDAHRDTAKTRTVTDRLGTPVAGVVVGRVAADASPDLSAVDGLADLPVLGVVPESAAVAAGTESREPVVLSDPDDPAALAYRRVAAELTSETSLLPDEGEEREASAGAGDGDEPDDGDVDETADEPEDEDDEPDETSTDADDLVEEAEPAADDGAPGQEAASEEPSVQETALFSSEESVVDEAEGGTDSSESDDGSTEKKGFFSRLFGFD